VTVPPAFAVAARSVALSYAVAFLLITVRNRLVVILGVLATFSTSLVRSLLEPLFATSPETP
jgi:hypothetical protein